MAGPFDLTGRTALVTGCSRGIGAAIAEALASSGADIVGVSTSLPDDGGAVGEAVRETGRGFWHYRCDLQDRAAVAALPERVDADGRAVDILVNNAGIIRREAIENHSDEDWDAVLGVNLTAAFMLARDFGRRMLERGAGRIIFVGSVLSFQGGVTVPGYAASKAGVANLAHSFANEWAPRGVNVNAVAPGYVATDNTAALQADSERSEGILTRTPAGCWGRPEDIAWPVVFLASDAARWVHGATLPVDGGWLGR